MNWVTRWKVKMHGNEGMNGKVINGVLQDKGVGGRGGGVSFWKEDFSLVALPTPHQRMVLMASKDRASG